MNVFESLFRLSSRALESGLAGMDAALSTAQKSLDGWTGQPPATARNRAPSEGPRGIDDGTAELANRLVRLARSTAQQGDWTTISQELATALRRSLPAEMPASGWQWLALSAQSAQVPFSLGTLAIQEMLRGLATAQSVPPRLLPDFLEFAVEIFGDLHIYFSLQYREELDRQIEAVRRNPDDARMRLELGRTYIKCGLYDQAVRELQVAAKDAAVRPRALYECTVADHRAGRYERAIAAGADSLALDPTNERARYWLWLSAKKAGGYPDEVPDALRMEARDGYNATSLELESVAEEIGLDKTAGGRGTAVFDFDGDGHLDIVIGGAHAGCSLYRNNGDGTFSDVSTGSGLDKCVYAFGLAAGDFDNDGRPDLFVSGLGFFDGQAQLFRNMGDGTFEDVTHDAGLDAWGPGFLATWVDYDCDGHLDLFVVNNLGGLFDRKTPNRLFHNNGDGTFTDVTEDCGLRTSWPSLGAAWGDFDNNGLPDLFVSNMGRSQLFRNNGDGTFTDVSRSAGIDAACFGSSALCCDIDNDGWLDIVQFTYSRPQDAIHTLRTGQGPVDGTPLRIYRNNRDGTFTLISGDRGINGCWGTMSGNAGDVSNNGHLDLLLGNGDPSMDRNEASVLLENDGRQFRNTTFAAGMPFTGKGHGVNMADLTGDGRLHLIVASGGLYPGDLQTTTVFRPKRLPGNYLNVRLQGTRCNRDAIGARVKLRAGGVEQHRLVSGGTGFGCLPCEQHFGLAAAEKVEAIEVRWPGGAVQRFCDLPVNTTVRLVEASSSRALDGSEIL